MKTNQYHNNMTELDYNFILQNYEVLTPNEMANKLNKALSTIYIAMNKLGVSKWRANGRKWSNEEIQFLKENYKTMKFSDIAIILNRSKSSISGQLGRLGLKKMTKNANWTQKEKQYLIDNIEKKTYQEIGNHLGRTVQSVRAKALELDILPKDIVNGVKLKKEHIQFILANYNKMTDKQLAIKFNVSETAIRDVRKKYNIKKTGNEVNGPTYIELYVKDLLDNYNVQYIYNEYLGEYRPDFVIQNSHIIIEVQGDYYHCNPYLYMNGPEDEVQVKHVLRDYYKKCYYLSKGYTIIEIWEHDINHNPNKVKEKIKQLTAVIGQDSQETYDD